LLQLSLSKNKKITDNQLTLLKQINSSGQAKKAVVKGRRKSAGKEVQAGKKFPSRVLFSLAGVLANLGKKFDQSLPVRRFQFAVNGASLFSFIGTISQRFISGM